MDCSVELCRSPREPALLRPVGGERDVLGDARVQRLNVLLLDAAESVLLEASRSLVRRASARKREDGRVLERYIARMGGQPMLCEVESSQQLPATLGISDELEPRRGVAWPRRLRWHGNRQASSGPEDMSAPVPQAAGSGRRSLPKKGRKRQRAPSRGHHTSATLASHIETSEEQ